MWRSYTFLKALTDGADIMDAASIILEWLLKDEVGFKEIEMIPQKCSFFFVHIPDSCYVSNDRLFDQRIICSYGILQVPPIDFLHPGVHFVQVGHRA